MQVATAEELYERPANAFVATFIGSPSMNMLTGRVVAKERPMFASGDRLWPLPLALPSGLSDRPAMMLGIRPEHLEILPQGSGAVPATVGLVESTEDEAIVSLELAGTLLKAKVRGRCRLRVGEAVELRFEPDEVHVFDARSEARISLPRDNPAKSSKLQNGRVS